MSSSTPSHSSSRRPDELPEPPTDGEVSAKSPWSRLIGGITRRMGQLPSRRFWLYVGSLVGSLGLLSVGTKVHKAVRALGGVAEGGAIAGGGHGASLDTLSLLGIIGSDLSFLAVWGFGWALTLHLTRGVTRACMSAVMQALTVFLLLFIVIEHAFFIVTGTQLDWDLLVYSAVHADRLQKVVSSEISAAWWSAGAGVAVVAALPWLWRPRDQDDRTNTASGAGRRTLVVSLSLFVLLVGVQLVFGDRPLRPQLQPLRKAPVVEHLRGGLQWAQAPDRSEANAAATGRPVEPLVVVRTERTRPLNVVLITLESVRARSLTPYNAAIKTTPRLAKLARRGTLFESAYTVVPHTTKSLIPLHCGIPPKLTPYFDEATKGGLPTDCLAKVLRRQGWRTHFIQTPESLFERRRDLVHAFGFTDLTSDENLEKGDFQRAGYFGYEDDVLIAPTMAWIDKHKRAHPDKPFFIGMLNVTTHHPYEVPSRFTPPTWPATGEGRATGHLAKYYNTLSYVDRFLGKLFDGFDKRGMAENTVFVLVGDHGEAFGEHDLFQHGHTMHEEGLRVPLLLMGPGIKANVRRGGLRQHIDVMPTLLEHLGLRVAAGDLPGRSLLTTDGHEKLRFACWRKDTCRALRTKDLKIIHHFGRRDDEAYDLKVDPEEQVDLVASGKVDKAARDSAIAELETWAKSVDARYGNQAKRRRNPWVSKQRPKDVGTPTDIVFDGWVRLIGYTVEKTDLRDGDATWVTTRLQVLKKPPPHGLIWLHAIGPKVRGKRKRRVADHVPVEGSYPVPEWKVGDFITDRHWLRMKPGHPSGPYDLYFGLYDPSNNQRAQPKGTGALLTTSNGVHLTVLNVTNRQTGPARKRTPLRRLALLQRERIWPADSTRPLPTPGGVTATFDDLARLRGVDISAPKMKQSEKASWTLHLTMLRDMPRWASPFVHITGPRPSSKRRRNVGMSPFGDRLPVYQWKKGWRLAIPLPIEMGSGFEPGMYDVWFGFWDPNAKQANQRFPARTDAPVSEDRVRIGSFELLPDTPETTNRQRPKEPERLRSNETKPTSAR